MLITTDGDENDGRDNCPKCKNRSGISSKENSNIRCSTCGNCYATTASVPESQTELLNQEIPTATIYYADAIPTATIVDGGALSKESDENDVRVIVCSKCRGDENKEVAGDKPWLTKDRVLKGAMIGGAVVAAPCLVAMATGFSAGGVVAGSVAAGWQSAIGNVAAGSLFANLTSLGATGTFATGATAGSATAAAAGAAYGAEKYSKKEGKSSGISSKENSNIRCSVCGNYYATNIYCVDGTPTATIVHDGALWKGR